MKSIDGCRRVTAAFVLITMASTQGCATYARPRGSLSPGSRVRVISQQAMPVHEGSGALVVAACEANLVEGVLERSRLDTLIFRSVRRLSLGDHAANCARGNGVTIVPPGDANVGVRRISPVRTTFAVLGLVLIVGLATSHVERGDGGCSTCPY